MDIDGLKYVLGIFYVLEDGLILIILLLAFTFVQVIRSLTNVDQVLKTVEVT